MKHTQSRNKKKAQRLTITVPPELYEESMTLARQFRFQGVSELVHHLMRLMLANKSPYFPITAAPSVSVPSDPAFRIEAFKELQRKLQMTPEKAAAWEATIKDARR